MNKNLKMFFIIPVLLIIIGSIFSFFYLINIEENPTIVSQAISANSIIQKHSSENIHLIIKGEIMPTSNYFGILNIRFKQSQFPLNGFITFRLKEKGQPRWYYENQYIAKNFYTLPFYPFGFPIIHNSKDKIYEFEIVSNDAKVQSSLQISNTYPTFVAKYQYPKAVLLQNPPILIDFILLKSDFAFQDTNFRGIIVLYFMPFLLYCLILFILDSYFPLKLKTIIKEKYNKFYNTYFVLLLTVMLIDIFMNPKYYDIITILITIFWIIGIIVKKTPPKGTFIIGIIFMIFSPILIQFKVYYVAEKSTLWSYTLLALSTFQILIEDFINKKHILTKSDKIK